jgi:hypothetical protein
MGNHQNENDLVESSGVFDPIAEPKHKPHEQKVDSGSSPKKVNEFQSFSVQQDQSDKDHNPADN